MKRTLLLVLCVGLVFFYACSGDGENGIPTDDGMMMVDSCQFLALSIISKSDLTCSEAGMIEVQATGGEEPYSYRLGNGSRQSSGLFTGLESGNYTVVVTDANECTTTANTSLLLNTGFNISFQTTESGCKENNGSITVSASGGEEPFVFGIHNNSSFSENNVFEELEADSYEIFVQDNTGCQESFEVSVLSGVSLNTNVFPIITANCAIPSCHGGAQQPLFTNTSNVIANASLIQNRTSSRSMPPASSGIVLSQEQIDLISCWVDDGAPNN
jgi:hypothetical protein